MTMKHIHAAHKLQKKFLTKFEVCLLPATDVTLLLLTSCVTFRPLTCDLLTFRSCRASCNAFSILQQITGDLWLSILTMLLPLMLLALEPSADFCNTLYMCRIFGSWFIDFWHESNFYADRSLDSQCLLLIHSFVLFILYDGHANLATLCNWK